LIALAGGLAAMALLAGCAGAPEESSYLRIGVSEKSVVYLQLQRDEIRAATSVEALPDSEPVRMSMAGNEPRIEIEQPVPLAVTPAPRFELTLPVPAGELPSGLTAVRASFLDGVLALTLCRADDRNVEWRCRTGWLDYQAGGSAADAPVVKLPDAARIRLAITGVPMPGKLAIGLNLMSGRDTMYLARMDGKSIAAQVRVVNEAGKEVASRQGKLSDFGSNCDGPCYVVPTGKGAYAVEATTEAGPFGGTLKAGARFAVP
jgi:hypothetical protein